jgi:hypothetical protein
VFFRREIDGYATEHGHGGEDWNQQREASAGGEERGGQKRLKVERPELRLRELIQP